MNSDPDNTDNRVTVDTLPEDINHELQKQFIAIASPIQWSLFPLIVLVVISLLPDTEPQPLFIWSAFALLDWGWVVTNNYLNRQCIARNSFPPSYENRNIINSILFGTVWGALPLVTMNWGTVTGTLFTMAIIPGLLSVLMLELSSTRKMFYLLFTPLTLLPMSGLLMRPPPLFYLGILGLVYMAVIIISYNIYHRKQFERINLALRTNSKIALLARAIEQYDSLTGLFNTVGLKTWLARSGADNRIAFALGNVRGFREINFLYGTTIADSLMQELALRLRDMAGSDICMTRLSGAEFLVVQSGHVSDIKSMERFFNQLQQEPIRIGDNEVMLMIDQVVMEGTAGEIDQLVAFAQDKLRAWINREPQEDSTLKLQLEKRRQLAFEFVAALDAGKIQPWFQPIVDCRTNRIVSWEALARWEHPTLGVIAPDSFLDIARISGLSTSLTQVMLREAIEFVHALQVQGMENLAFVSVNFRVSELMDPANLDWIKPMLKMRPLQPGQIAIEVSEKEALIFDEQLDNNLKHMQELGIEIVIDDFGTGFSNLAHLLDLKPSKVKLDKRFIKKLPEDRNSAALLRAVLAMATELCIITVAEGVEKESQLAFLSENGCIAYQGWLAGEAVPLTQALLMARGWASQDRPAGAVD